MQVVFRNMCYTYPGTNQCLYVEIYILIQYFISVRNFLLDIRVLDLEVEGVSI